jgi:hypothetical protein
MRGAHLYAELRSWPGMRNWDSPRCTAPCRTLRQQLTNDNGQQFQLPSRVRSRESCAPSVQAERGLDAIGWRAERAGVRLRVQLGRWSGDIKEDALVE